MGKSKVLLSDLASLGKEKNSLKKMSILLYI